MARVKLALFLLLFLTASIVRAQAVIPPGLLIYNAWVRPTAPALAEGATPAAPMPGTVAGAYLSIANTSGEDYQWVGIDADLAEMAMLHESSVDDKGIARMRMVMTLDIPAGQTITFAPGGYHVMLADIRRDIYPGDAVALRLTFADRSGATFGMTVGALALDFPPEDDTLIAANALALPDANDADVLNVSLTLDNRGDADVLINASRTVSSDLGGTALIMSLVSGRAFPYTTLEIAAQAQTVFAPDGVFIRLSDLAEPPGEAFPLTLTFESGRTLTVAVPVANPEAES